MDKSTYIGNADVSAIDYLYKQYSQSPDNVDIGWQKFFEGFDFARTNYEDKGQIPENYLNEFRVINLINGYRTRGHLFTKTNPVRERRQYSPTLEIENFELKDVDLDIVFQAGEIIGIGPSPLREIINHLESTYCQSLGIEYVYIRDPERVDWIKNKIELKNRPIIDKARKIEIFKKLNQASSFEAFLGKKFVGQKRFSVEGGRH